MSWLKAQRRLERKRCLQLAPPSPLEFTVTSEIFDKLPVTEHAWNRFCHRYFSAINQISEPGKYGTKFFTDRFRECFSRAREAPLPVSYATVRIINNDFQSAGYVLDPQTNLRFVVRDETTDEGSPCILTVEIAYRC